MDGAPAGDWSIAEGAPTIAAIVGRSGGNLLGVRVGEQVQSATLIEGKAGALGLTALTIGPNAWAVWREGSDRIESCPFPR